MCIRDRLRAVPNTAHAAHIKVTRANAHGTTGARSVRHSTRTADVAVSTSRADEATSLRTWATKLMASTASRICGRTTLPAAIRAINAIADASCQPTGHCSQAREYQGLSLIHI